VVRVGVSVLGGVEARLDDAVVGLGSPKQRALLAALALHRGRAVSTDTLVDLLWADSPPAQWATTLQGYVAGLRRALEPGRPARAPATVLVTAPGGYALHVAAADLDAARFDAAVGACHQRLGAPALATAGPSGGQSATELEGVIDGLDDALALWRGTPYGELEDAPAAVAERVRLEELRLVALEDRAVAALALGRHATVAAELEGLTTSYPLRERLWALRALALTRSGRQADALDVLRQVRELLAEELGLEPGQELRDLQTAVLRQDPSLEATVPAPPTRRPVVPVVPAVPAAASPWPMIGRDAELDVLVTLLDESSGSGTPRFAAVVGDPGIGKSRMLAELTGVARHRGWGVTVGRCSQDDGAPPLWPWLSVLDALGAAPPDASRELQADAGAQFRVWDDIVRAVADAATAQPLLVLLDDLHWADASSLRVLGLLLESVTTGALVVVSTWRDKPVLEGALATVAEQLSRRHAARIPLTGLGTGDVGEIVAAVSAHRPSTDQADALRARTDGNPFFLVEYARLVDEEADLATLLAEPDPPHAVTDVVSRRLARLDDAVQRALLTAAVVGRDFDLATVAAASEDHEDDLLDAFDVAIAAGLVREDGVGRFRFAHALVRDTVYAGTSRTRRARWHARVAEALAGSTDRAGEVARHWHAAGPGHAGEAWRADRAAASVAMGVLAYDEAVSALDAALATIPDDPTATARDEYDLLLDLARAVRAAGDWVRLRDIAHRGITVAQRLEDVVATAEIAMVTSTDALWQPSRHGEVDAFSVKTLRDVLDALPGDDDPLRCRLMLALAGELYYAQAPAERDALVDEAVAMARRLGDPLLLVRILSQAGTTLWRPGTAARRRELWTEALTLGESLGLGPRLSSVRLLVALSASEFGDVELLDALSAQVRDQAESRRDHYTLMVLDTLDVSWLTMRGDLQLARERLAHLTEITQKLRLEQAADGLIGAHVSIAMWARDYDAIVPLMRYVADEGVLPADTATITLLGRAGDVDRARRWRQEHEPDLSDVSWYSSLNWALAAEAAAYVDDRDLAAEAYELLTPLAGMLAIGGTGCAVGPVDSFLALAAHVTGEHDLARRHADDALALCHAWRIPPVEQWLLDQRDRYGF
jgi:DNA-binding SARP family transcriptional activator